jgi:hypothetical protein
MAIQGAISENLVYVIKKVSFSSQFEPIIMEARPTNWRADGNGIQEAD